jgi:hypothetical protein
MHGMNAQEQPGNSDKAKGSGFAQRVFLSPPFIAGVLAVAGVDLADEFANKVRAVASKEFLAGVAALDAAFGGIAIAVLALVAVWFDDSYQQVLERLGGWTAAMRPFRVAAVVSVLGSLVAVVSLLVFPASPLWLQALLLGVAGGLLIWSVVATLRVIDLIFKHGARRARLIADTRSIELAALAAAAAEQRSASDTAENQSTASDREQDK